ncbi:MAG: immunoglobulin domain-containing protein [Verrucomicrobia bacterium]|nr:immunoglobulin domain-containing protein [Verrucomicrobiota bacterium]
MTNTTLRTALAAICLFALPASAAVVNAAYNSPADVPVTAASYTAAGNTVTFALNHVPVTGEHLMVVKNTGLAFIQGAFDNLAQGQKVALTYLGITYNFVANYYGGTGNDLVLRWVNTRPMAWGLNDFGQLGNNGTVNSNIPIAVNTAGILSGKTIVAVATGYRHSLALCSDGTLAAWGNNGVGQLGDNSTADRLVPADITTSGILSGKTVVAITAGNFHSLALCADGTVAAWGSNSASQLGTGDTADSSVPVAVNCSGVLSGKSPVAIGAGDSHSLALCADGTVAAWGSNDVGQLGNDSAANSSVPVAITTSGSLAGRKVVSIAAGNRHNLALCADGTLAAWGYNNNGQLGNGNTGSSRVPVAITTSGILSTKAVVGISAGWSHSLALCSDNTVAAWGWNLFGQLGNNSRTNSSIPVAANNSAILSGKTIAAIAAGDDYSLALCTDGTASAWGNNSSWQLGNGGSGTYSLVPIAVSVSPLAAGERMIAAGCGQGASHNLALVAAPPWPVVATAAATSLSSAGATLNGIVNANSNSTTVSFEYGLTVAYGTSVAGTPSPLTGGESSAVTANLSGLASATTYHYRVIATNSLGTARGADMTFVTAMSANANLASLSTSTGTLSPSFDSATTNYTTRVSNTTPSITITPTVADALASVRVHGSLVNSGGASAPIQLAVGSNVISVAVTAQDGITTKTYTVTVTRVSTNAALASLATSVGMLNPAFDSATTSYAMTVPFAATGLRLAPALADNTATISVNGVVCNGTGFTDVIALAPGTSVIRIAVTAQDGSTTKTYQVTVTRLSATAAIPNLVMAWGAGATNPGTDPEFGQSMVPGSLGAGTTAVAGGLYHSVALKNDGTVTAWGYNGYGQTNIPPGLSTVNAVATLPYTSVTAVAAFQPNPAAPGTVNSCTITVSPTVNTHLIMSAIIPGMTVTGPANSVGTGATIASKITSGNVTTLTFSVANAVTDATVVSPFNATLTIAAPAAWGGNLAAVTVTPTSNTSLVPAAVLAGMVVTGPPGSVGTGAVVVSKTTITTTNPVGGVTILALSQPHASSPQGEFSILITPVSPVQAVAAGGFHSLALKSDGSVVAWGAGTSSTASAGTANLTQSSVPLGMTTLTAVAATVPANPTGLVNTITLGAANTGIVPGMMVTGPGLTVGAGAKVLSVSGTTVTLSVPNVNTVLTPASLTFSTGVVAIAAGYYHSVALKSDGSVVAWGDNTAGQTTVPTGLQTFSSTSALPPNPAPGTVNTLTLAANNPSIVSDMLVTGPLNSVGVGASILYKSGASPWTLTLSVRNAVNPNGGSLSIPILCSPGVKAVAIAAGNEHTMALRADGSIVSWGRNVEGQTCTSGLSPLTASATLPGSITATADLPAGPAGTVTLAAANAAIVSGMAVSGGAPGTLGAGATVVSKDADGVTLTLSVPNSNTAAINGVTLTFATRPNNTITLAAPNPAIIPGMYVTGPAATVGVGATVVSKAADNVTLTLSSRNAYVGTTDSAATALTFSTGIKATAIAAGGDTSYVLKPDASVAAWGDNHNGQTNVPGGLTGVTAIAAGGDHVLALKNNGTVTAWGKIWNGSTYINETVPAGLSGVTAIAAGAYHAVAVAAAQPPIITSTPPASLTVTQGGTATMSIVAAGAVGYQWLKSGVAIPGASGATLLLNNVQAGDASNYSVVVTNAYGSVTSTPVALTVNAPTTGAVLAWGAGATNTGSAPEYGHSVVPGSLSAGTTAVAGGLYHSVALKNDGTVTAWGYNGYGQTIIPNGLSKVNAVATLPYASVTAVATFQPNPASPGTVNTCTLTVSPSVNTNLIMSAILPGMTVSGPANSVGYSGVTITSKITSGSVTTLTFAFPNAVTDATVVNPFSAILTIAAPAAWGGNLAAVTVTPTSNTGFAAAAVLAGMVVTGPPGSVGLGATVVGKTIITTTNPAGSVTVLALSAAHAVSPLGDIALTIAPVAPVKAIVAGALHTLALKSNGTVVAWGAGTTNVAGTANLGQSIIPAGLTTLTGVAATIPRNDTGLVNTVTLTAANPGVVPGMWVTGPGNTVGIGAKVLSVSGTTVTLSVPNLNTDFTPSSPTFLNFYSGVTAIAAGYYHSVALRNDGSVVAWGDNTAGQATVPTGLQTFSFTSILPPNPAPPATVNTLTLAANNPSIVPDMTVTGAPNSVGAGASILYKSGVSPWTLTLSVPNAVNPNAGSLSIPILYSPGVKAVAIAAGNEHTMVLRADGSIMAWGRNVEGQTCTSGLSPLTASATLPGSITATADLPAGPTRTVTLAAANAAIVPGMAVSGGAPGTLGAGATVVSKDADDVTLTLSVPNTNAAAIAGVTLTFATRPNNTVTLATANPAIVPGMYVTGPASTVGVGATVVSKAADNVTLTLSGRNAYVGATDSAATTLTFSAGIKATAIAAGGDTSYGLKPDATVAAWGDNHHGQTNVPGGLTGVTAIAAGGDHVLALKNNGTVTAWGKIWNGSTYITETVPAGLGGVTAIAAGAYNAVAIAAIQSPVITAQPASVTVNQGGTATFGVIAAGAAPLTYRWRKNGTYLTNSGNLSGVTSATLVLTNAQLADASSYSLVVANATGSVTSAAATLTVIAMTPDAVVAWGAGTTNPGAEPDYGQSIVPAGLAGVTRSTAAGLYHTVALKTDGSVAAWGANGYGQTTVPPGLATITATATLPANPNPPGTVKTVTLTATNAGIVAGMWVGGPPGTVGTGAVVTSISGTTLTLSVANANTDQTTTSLTFSPATPVTAIAAGAWHTLALKSNGTVVAWGAGTSSTATAGSVHQTQSAIPLGLTTLTGVAATIPRNDTGLINTITLGASNSGIVPGMLVSGPGLTVGAGAKVLDAAGTTVTLSVPNVNTVLTPTALTFSTGVVAIAAGYYHSVALKSDGSVVAWGDNSEGQTTVPAGLALASATAQLPPNPAPGGVNTLALPVNYANIVADMRVTGPFGSVGAGATLVTKRNGVPSLLTLSVPHAVNSLGAATNTSLLFTPGVGAVAIAAGFDHTVALRSDGTVVAWGRNVEGQTGGVAPFTAAATLPGIPLTASAALDANPSPTVTLAAADASIVPGMSVTGADGTVGAGATIVSKDGTGLILTLSVPNANPVAVPATTLTFSATTLSNNTVTLAATNPAITPGMLVTGAAATVGTGATVIGKDASGLILTLSGRNAYGGTANSPVTLTFSSPVTATAIAAGGDTTYALKTDSTVAAWGDDSNGQTDIPAGLSGVTAIAAGGDHAAALRSNGTVVTWGKIWNGYGYVNETVPGGLSGVTGIAAGGFHTVAVVGGPAITISSHPANRTAIIGVTATFTVSATGTAPLSYQWQKNGVNLTNTGNISGATAATLTLANVQLTDAANYAVLVTDTYGSITSTAAVLTVIANPLPDAVDRPDLAWTTGGDAPWFAQTSTTHDGIDAARSGAIGDAKESWLQTTLMGPGTLGYWWKVSSEDTWDFLEFYLDGVLQSGRVTGETGWQQRSLAIPAGSHTVKWRYVKDDAFNGGQDAGWLDEVSYVVDIPVTPQIVTQPVSLVSVASATVTFTVTATGSAPLTWQWRKNTADLTDGGNVAGSTTSTLTLANIQLTDVGSYTVVVSNGAGSATSTAATLALEPPLVTTDSASGITTTTATLNGTVNPNGLATSARFEYGPTSAYGSKLRVTLAPDSGLVTQMVSLSLSGLLPGTTYHYRLTATSDIGTTLGADLTFSTPPAAPPITAAELLPPKLAIAGGNLIFTIEPTVPGRIYQLQQSNTLAPGPWLDVGPARTGNGNPLVITTPREPTASRRFYRIALDN